jgi:proliferating cell nuclear antigen
LELVLANADVFKKSIEAISVLIDEADIIVSAKGLELRATDPSQISLVDFFLPKEAFEKFVSEETRLGLDLDYLNQVLSRAQAGDQLTLALDDKKSSLSVSFKGRAKRSFSVPLIDISAAEPPKPKIEFDAELNINASFLQNAFKDVGLISTHITLACDSSKFFIKANSSKGSLNEELEQNKESMPEFKVKNECKSTFPLDYIQDMLKAAPSDSLVNINLKTNAPIKVSYALGKASITYFLAPRIDSV